MKSSEQQKKSHAKWQKDNIDKVRQANRESYRRNAEKRIASTKKYAERQRLENPEAVKVRRDKWYARNKFKLALQRSAYHAGKRSHYPCMATEEEVRSAYTGFCDICGISDTDSSRPFHMDHCHATGKFRGWLCGDCNTAAGLLKESADIALKLSIYLDYQ